MKCKNCRLYKTCDNIMQMGHGNPKPTIMIVQDMPDHLDNTRNKHLTGRVGRFLKTGLLEVGIDEKDIYFTSAVKCNSPGDRPPLPDEIKACSDYLMAEIEVTDPDFIIPLGNASLKALTRRTGITKLRGKPIDFEIGGRDRVVFPLLHPNTVLRQPKYLELFSKDLITLVSVLTGEDNPELTVYEKEWLALESFDEVMEELERLDNLPKDSFVTFDLETVKANPFIPEVDSSKKTAETYPESLKTKIVAIGFSDRPGYGVAIPLFHRQTPFTDKELEKIMKKIKELFLNDKLIFSAQNGKFDMKWLRVKHNIEIENFVWDTMLMHYIAITEEQGTHGLSDLAWLETDLGGYDEELNRVAPKGQDEGNFDLIEWDILKVYLAGDCDVTFRILKKYIKHFKEGSDFRWIWDNLMKPGIKTLLDIECNGLYVNQEWLKILEDAYPKEIERIEQKLHQFPEVVEMERERLKMWEERVAIGKIKKANRTEEQQNKFTKWVKYNPSRGGTDVNFGSTQQIGELFFERLGLQTVILTDKGNPSTNEESLIYMQGQHPICDMLLDYRKVRHLYNTFVAGLHPLICPDSIVHPSYNLHGTVTGRLSSNNPNGQQIPRVSYNPLSFQYNHEIKKLFSSRFGEDGVIVQLD